MGGASTSFVKTGGAGSHGRGNRGGLCTSAVAEVREDVELCSQLVEIFLNLGGGFQLLRRLRDAREQTAVDGRD